MVRLSPCTRYPAGPAPPSAHGCTLTWANPSKRVDDQKPPPSRGRTTGPNQSSVTRDPGWYECTSADETSENCGPDTALSAQAVPGWVETWSTRVPGIRMRCRKPNANCRYGR